MLAMTIPSDTLYQQLSRMLREAFGELVREAPEEPAFFVPSGRIGVRVEVEAVSDQNVLIECYSWVAQGLPIDGRVCEFLVRRNASLRFGALCVDGEGSIFLRHALFAEQLQEPVLSRLIQLLGSTADTIDDELRERFAR
jgi:hypothetical protein